MKFLENIINRIVTHWQSTLFGLSYFSIFILIVTKHITVPEALALLAAILGFKGVFVNKDPDKTLTKPAVKEKQINILDDQK